MSALLFLESEDFCIQRGIRGNILCHGIEGYSLILFYSTHCVHCQKLVPIFKQLPGTVGGCQFGMINVSQNRQCVAMSQQTIAPVNYVPYIVFYVDGKPFMIYKGPYDAGEIRRFVVEVGNNVQKRQQFSKATIQAKPRKIPEYTIGVPVKGGEDVCYLKWDDAYVPGKPGKR